MASSPDSEIPDADESVEAMVAAFHEEREVGCIHLHAPCLLRTQHLTARLLRDDDWT